MPSKVWLVQENDYDRYPVIKIFRSQAAAVQWITAHAAAPSDDESPLFIREFQLEDA